MYIDTSEKTNPFHTRSPGFDSQGNFQLDPDYKPDYELLKNAELFRCSIVTLAKILKKDEVRVPTPSCGFNLPKVSAPKFNGEIAQWPVFFEKFESIIHRNPNLDDLGRTHYHLGALKGKALDVCVGQDTPERKNLGKEQN